MFKVYVNDGTTTPPTDDIYYIIAKEGIYLKKKVGIMESIAPVQQISILDNINLMAKMHIKKIPGGQLANIVSFFKEVYQKFKGEAIVLLFYNEEKRIYKIIPPKQKVSGCACDYEKGIVIEGMQMIGTIHSHASMSAFHSGVDHSDEKHFDGLHITIGNVDQENVSISASIVSNGHRFMVSPEDYLERVELIKEEIDNNNNQHPLPTKVYKWVDGKLVESTEDTNKYFSIGKSLNKRYKLNISDKYKKVPDTWMETVEQKVYSPSMHPFTGSWGHNYNPNLWTEYMKEFNRQNNNNNISPLNVGESATITPLKFPDHCDIYDIDDIDKSKCQSCRHRQNKFILEEEMDDEPVIYKCEKCNTFVIENIESEGAIICPVCKSDEHLMEIDDEQLPSNYEKESLGNEDFVTCKCGNIFYKEDGCHYCDHDNLYNNINNQQSIDSGSYFFNETEEINNEALKENYSFVEKIADPCENGIPIPENIPKTKETEDDLLHLMFRKIFRREKK